MCETMQNTNLHLFTAILTSQNGHSFLQRFGSTQLPPSGNNDKWSTRTFKMIMVTVDDVMTVRL